MVDAPRRCSTHQVQVQVQFNTRDYEPEPAVHQDRAVSNLTHSTMYSTLAGCLVKKKISARTRFRINYEPVSVGRTGRHKPHFQINPITHKWLKIHHKRSHRRWAEQGVDAM